MVSVSCDAELAPKENRYMLIELARLSCDLGKCSRTVTTKANGSQRTYLLHAWYVLESDIYPYVHPALRPGLEQIRTPVKKLLGAGCEFHHPFAGEFWKGCTPPLPP